MAGHFFGHPYIRRQKPWLPVSRLSQQHPSIEQAKKFQQIDKDWVKIMQPLGHQSALQSVLVDDHRVVYFPIYIYMYLYIYIYIYIYNIKYNIHMGDFAYQNPFDAMNQPLNQELFVGFCSRYLKLLMLFIGDLNWLKFILFVKVWARRF